MSSFSVNLSDFYSSGALAPPGAEGIVTWHGFPVMVLFGMNRHRLK
jgi:hypothetical protein